MPNYDWDLFHQSVRDLIRQVDCREVVYRAKLSRRPPHGSSALKARCPHPAHEDKSPSCSVFAQRWNCHGCREQGDILDLIRHLEGAASYKEQVAIALSYIGLNYEQLQAEFIQASQAQGTFTPPTPSPSALSVPISPKRAPAPETRHPLASKIWSQALVGLKMERWAALYVYSRGLSDQLAQALGWVGVDYETWAERIEGLIDEHGEEVIEACGLLTDSGAVHPYIERMMIIPYVCAQGIESLRFRRLSDDDTYDGVKYLSLRHRINSSRLPFLGQAHGVPLFELGDAHPLYVVEGEFDALSLRAMGRRVIGVPGAKHFLPQWVQGWADSQVIVIQDQDPGDASSLFYESIHQAALDVYGEAWVSAHLHTRRVDLPDCKDLNDLALRQLLEAWIFQLEDDLKLMT